MNGWEKKIFYFQVFNRLESFSTFLWYIKIKLSLNAPKIIIIFIKRILFFYLFDFDFNNGTIRPYRTDPFHNSSLFCRFFFLLSNRMLIFSDILMITFDLNYAKLFAIRFSRSSYHSYTCKLVCMLFPSIRSKKKKSTKK